MDCTDHNTDERARMDCAGCALKIENALRRVPGVEQVDVPVARGTVTVKHHKTNSADIKSRIFWDLGMWLPARTLRQPGRLGMTTRTKGPHRKCLPGLPTSTIMDLRASDGGKPARPV